jgi:hypothetical protein
MTNGECRMTNAEGTSHHGHNGTLRTKSKKLCDLCGLCVRFPQLNTASNVLQVSSAAIWTRKISISPTCALLIL